MARGKQAKRKSEVKKLTKKQPLTKKPTKSKAFKLKAKASNKHNNRALESSYGSITKESKNWGKRTREMVNSYGAKVGDRNPRKRQRKAIPIKKSDDPRKKFELKMPKVEGGAPWWKTPSISPPPTKNMRILNSISVDSRSMSLLDQELMEFCKYVQLAPQETQVRDHLIQTIQKGAMERFGIKEADIQVFGSYAALPVCTFESDIDLAIWGLVGGNKEPPSDASEQDYKATRDEKQPSDPQEPQLDHPNRKKQDKILKWKAAIDEFERQLKATDSEDGKSENKEAQNSRTQNGSLAEANDKATTQTRTEVKPSLFVIDRVGDISEDADAKPTAKTGANDDSKSRKIPAWGDKAVELLGKYEITAHSDDDSADKLEGLKSRVDSHKAAVDDPANQQMLALPDAEGLAESSASVSTNVEDLESAYAENDLYGAAAGGDDEEEEAMITTPKRRARSQSLVSLSSATTCSSDNQSVDEAGLEVSFFNEPKRRFSESSHATKISDDTRGLINSKLNQLSKIIRRAGLATSIAVRKWARVPIINMCTKYGFECDIAVGGHNGNDTSAYAATQIARHQSFAPVVILLKIILNQHDLDKPFTGGLGSFKLYVLVANHIERHLALGGSDSPAEILLMFFFRYGNIPGFRGISPAAETNLMGINSVQCRDGGLVEMKHVFHIENCVKVFRACWGRLKMLLEKKNATQASFVRWIVHTSKLAQRRAASIKTLSNGGMLPVPGAVSRTWSQSSSVQTLVVSEKRKRPPAVTGATLSTSAQPLSPSKKKTKRPPGSPTNLASRAKKSPPTEKAARARKHSVPQNGYARPNQAAASQGASHPPSETGVATRTRSHSFSEDDYISEAKKAVHKIHNGRSGDETKASKGVKALTQRGRKRARSKSKRKGISE